MKHFIDDYFVTNDGNVLALSMVTKGTIHLTI